MKNAISLLIKIHLLTLLLLLAGTFAYAQDKLYDNEFPLGDVKLLDGVLKDARDLNIKTLLQYDCDRLLAPIRKEAGLEPKAPLYPNWAGLDGHVAGHYLSAMAMNAASGDKECQKRMDYMLSELQVCLEAGMKNNPTWGAGYLGGIPESAKIWTAFKEGEFGPYFGAWAPFYNLHKMFAGLRDAWVYCGRENAKDLFLEYCDWAIFITAGLSDEQMERMLGNEHGGMNEVLADAFAISGDEKYLDCAKRFSHRFLLDPMASHDDMLDNLHANTQVPKAVGFERIYQLGGDEKYHDASLFFWETVTSNRSLAFGGNSRREHFPTRETSIDYVNDIDGAESCNTYNMLKLTEDLFGTSPEQRFAEYYERATFNHILSTQHPEHGGYVYFTSARPRHYRNYSAPNEAMWCCVGTGMENHGKYGQFIYTKNDDDLYINLFIASELDWKEKDVVIRQETSFPYSECSSIKVVGGGGRFRMMLRYPTWVKEGAYSIKVNGKDIDVAVAPGNYVAVERKWKEGDIIEVSFPMANRVEHLPNVPQYVALMHGPILLAMKTGTEDLKHLVADDSRFGQYADGEKLPIDKAPFFIAEDVGRIADDIVPIEGKPLHFTIKTRMENPIAGELQPFFEIHDSRYMIYWLAFDNGGYQDYMKELSASEAALAALDARTVDKVQPGEQQPETDHQMRSDGSRPGNTNGVAFRDARDGGSFSYLMNTGGRTDLSVMVKYWGQDEWKTCEYDLFADDVLVKSVNNSKKWRTSQWKTESYPIPSSALEGKKEVRIKFVAKPGKQVGEIYELRLVGSAEASASIDVTSAKPSGFIDEKLYGQLFEHIYFSANNGVWNEMIFERSFEPEHYPGITPRDGYFDGWFADDDGVLHSPTRYEQPIRLTSVDTDDYEITMDVNWRSYRLARRAWSGGLLDIRFACKNQRNGEPYYVRIHNPYYEARILNVGQTEAMAAAARDAEAKAAAQKQISDPNFSTAVMAEKEMPFFGGRTRKVKTLDPISYRIADASQINENQDWHKLRISCKGGSMRVYWDGKRVLSESKLEAAGKNDIVFWVNYTETTYRNIKVSSSDGKEVFFDGLPDDVRIPEVAPQWTAFGEGEFALVKGDAVNMDYSQKVCTRGEAGVLQGPQAVKPGEHYVGSVYAKGDAKLSVALVSGGKKLALSSLGRVGKDWKEYKFDLDPAGYVGDADFAICAEDGTLQVDQVTMSSSSGIAAGGFRPDILETVKSLHPTCLRWPGGGYAAQYEWQWGVGPQKDRRRWAHWQWMDYDQNCFGTDEFIKFCREINSEPIIVVSVHFEKPESQHAAIVEEACNWLRYCNEPATGEWGAKRAANGHPEPYNVKYWEIDNEMWEMGIDRYEAYVRDIASAFKQIDPSVKIIVCGGFQEDEDFLSRSGNLFDYMSLHHYEQQDGYATGPANLGELYDRYAKMIAASPNPNVKLFISEWNLQTIDWRTGLFAGGFLNECEKREVVAMGAAALFIRRTDMPDWNNAFINFDYKDVFVAPNYQVTKLWYDHFSSYLLDYKGDTGDLNVVSTLSGDGSNVILKVVNPTEKAIALKVRGDWKGRNAAGYEYYAPGSLTVQNSMTQKEAVKLSTAVADYEGDVLKCEIPAFSAGVITVPRF